MSKSSSRDCDEARVPYSGSRRRDRSVEGDEDRIIAIVPINLSWLKIYTITVWKFVRERIGSVAWGFLACAKRLGANPPSTQLHTPSACKFS